MSVVIKVITRELNPESDIGYILATWTKRTCPKQILRGSKADRDKWFAEKGEYISNALVDSEVVVACLDEDADFIVGYAVYSPDLEIMNIKSSYRNQGVEALLNKGK